LKYALWASAGRASNEQGRSKARSHKKKIAKREQTSQRRIVNGTKGQVKTAQRGKHKTWAGEAWTAEKERIKIENKFQGKKKKGGGEDRTGSFENRAGQPREKAEEKFKLNDTKRKTIEVRERPEQKNLTKISCEEGGRLCSKSRVNLRKSRSGGGSAQLVGGPENAAKIERRSRVIPGISEEKCSEKKKRKNNALGGKRQLTLAPLAKLGKG